MKKANTVSMELSEIREQFFVRTALNNGRVEALRTLHQNGVDLGPLVVSESPVAELNGILIDGRHRKVMYLGENVKKAEVELRRYDSLAEMIVDAMKCNSGGALPPTDADTNHALQELLESGTSRKAIIEMISTQMGLPKKLIQGHLDVVQSNMFKARVIKAKNAVINSDMTAQDAALKYDVDVKSVRKALGSEDKNKIEGSNQQIKATFSTVAKKLSLTVGHNMSRILRELKDGVMTTATAVDTFHHLDHTLRKLVVVHEQWAKRIAVQTEKELVPSVVAIMKRHKKKDKPHKSASSEAKPDADSEKPASPAVSAFQANARKQFKGAKKAKNGSKAKSLK